MIVCYTVSSLYRNLGMRIVTSAAPRSLYSLGFYTVKKPIAHILTNTKFLIFCSKTCLHNGISYLNLNFIYRFCLLSVIVYYIGPGKKEQEIGVSVTDSSASER